MLLLYLLEPDARHMRDLAALCTELCGIDWEIRLVACAQTTKALLAQLDDSASPALFLLGEAEGLDEAIASIRRQNSLDYLVLLLNTPAEALTLRPAYYRPAGFLVKPVDKEALSPLLACIYEDYQMVGDVGDIFVVRVRGAVYPIAYRDILYFESVAKKVYARTAAQEFSFYGSLEEIHANAPASFLRVHRGFCANLRHVRAMNRNENLLVMSDGSRIPVSRTYKGALETAFDAAGR